MFWFSKVGRPSAHPIAPGTELSGGETSGEPLVVCTRIDAVEIPDTKSRISLLYAMLRTIRESTQSPCLLVLPAGYLDAQEGAADVLCRKAARAVRKMLSQASRGSLVCLGVDGRSSRDQLGIAVSRDGGTVGQARKFFPVGEEREYLVKAESASAPEGHRPRVFTFAGHSFYIAICYDSFGLKKQHVQPMADGVVNLVHGFNRPGEPDSGSFYFARDGMLGAARTWECPVFAAAHFVGGIHRNWPTAVAWDPSCSPVHWRYVDNPVRSIHTLECRHKEETALLDVYLLSDLGHGLGTDLAMRHQVTASHCGD